MVYIPAKEITIVSFNPTFPRCEVPSNKLPNIEQSSIVLMSDCKIWTGNALACAIVGMVGADEGLSRAESHESTEAELYRLST